MEENPRGRGTRREGDGRARQLAGEGGGGGGAEVKCSGKGCRSCTGGVIADCVAVCCCPCAVLNLLFLAFVKVPWMVGRRCLGRWKAKGRRQQASKRKCRKIQAPDSGTIVIQTNDETGGRPGRSEVGISGNSPDAEKNEKFDAESETAWSAQFFVPFGHLGFGRVSFSGEPPPGHGD